MKRTKKQKKVLSTYELMDWNCPVYEEWKEGSTNQRGVCLHIHGLLNGEYTWNVVFRRERDLTGREWDWHIGIPERDQTTGSFEEMLARARVAMDNTPLPLWRQ